MKSGVAKKAQLVSVKMIRCDGTTDTLIMAKAIEWVTKDRLVSDVLVRCVIMRWLLGHAWPTAWPRRYFLSARAQVDSRLWERFLVCTGSSGVRGDSTLCCIHVVIRLCAHSFQLL